MSTATGANLRPWNLQTTSGHIVDDLTELSHAMNSPDFIISKWIIENENFFDFPAQLIEQAHALENKITHS